MADYWKSQPRKFCEFCKCWIADNKPSRDFHEKGKKHQQMVQNKLNFVLKKGTKDSKQEAQMKAALKAMEKGALQSVKKDLQKNPEMAAHYGMDLHSTELEDLPNPSTSSNSNKGSKSKGKPNKKGSGKPMIGPSLQPQEPIPVPEVAPSPAATTATADTTADSAPYPKAYTAADTTAYATPDSTATSTTAEPTATAIESGTTDDANSLWKEEWTPEGYVYYWNTTTGVTTWEKPEGYTPTWERPGHEKQQQQQPRTESEQMQREDNLPQEQLSQAEVETDQTASSSSSSSSLDHSPPEPDQQTEQPSSTEGEQATPGMTQQPEADSPSEGPSLPVEQPETEATSSAGDSSNGGEPSVAEVSSTDTTLATSEIPLPAPKPSQPYVAERAWYGAWESIKAPVPQKPVDLELPVDPNASKVEVKTIPANEPKIKFRQKKVDTLGAEFVAFKKRKLNAAQKGRRTTDTEMD